MQYHSSIRIWFCIVSLFHPFRASFFLSKDNVLFHCYHRRWLSFPSQLLISLSPTSVTTRFDRCYHPKFNPRPSYFHHLAGGRVAAVHEEGSPDENIKRTAIHHQSLVPWGMLARRSVPKMLRYIPPQPPPTIPPPYKGILNRYSPLQEILECWRACMP